MVVYQLHAQAVRSTVWKNVRKIQNVPELRLPFTQIRSICRKTAAEAGLKLVSNGGFEEMEHEFPFERFRPEKNRTTFSDFQLLPEIFRWNDPRRFVPFTF